MNYPHVIKKAGEVSESGMLIQNIVIRPVHRIKLDIQAWRNSCQQAEGINGNRVPLYDLYEDALLDAFLYRMVQKRVLAVLKHKLHYINAKKIEIKEANSLIDSLQFRNLRECIQLQKAWGIAVIELMNDNGKLKIFDVPKKHIRPQDGLIVNEQYSYEGINYREPPYNKTVVEIGHYNDLGYLLQAGCYAIYKRGSIADWANYAQIFGMPFREARYDGSNEVVRLQLERALEAAASAAWAVLPKDAELTIHEAMSGANSSELYNTIRTAMNEEIMVLIIGATETTTSSQSSGYAQSQTHHKSITELAQDDKIKELCILNEIVLPVLVNLGLLPQGGQFANEDPFDLDIAKIRINNALQIKQMGFPVDANNIYEISGLKKPPNYDKLK